MTQETLFTPPPVDNQDRDYLSELVGEGKKFKTQADLAKGKVEADTFIEQLKTDNKALRDDLAARKRLEELIDTLATSNGDPEPTTPQDSHAQTPVDLEAFLEQKLNERDQRSRRDQNIRQVKDALRQTYGDNFAQKLSEVTSSLGMDANAVNDLAARSPQAVLRLFGGNAPQAPAYAPPPSSSVTFPSTPSGNTERNQAYYDKLKAQDSKLYWSPKVQSQLHQDAIRLGENFFN